MSNTRFAVIGAGFWARFQLHGWKSLGEVECIAICDRDMAKARALAADFGIQAVYEDAETMFASESFDFVDIITGVEAHKPLVQLAVSHRIPVICQKPLASSLEDAEEIVRCCREAGIPLLVNENWRWQRPIRELKQLLEAGEIGRPFRARVNMVSGFCVFNNQPALRRLKQFVLADVGSHILDAIRFLFGEPRMLFCLTQQVHRDICGEDVATVLIETCHGMSVIVELGYAENYLERDKFPETWIFIEGEQGSIEITHNSGIRVTTSNGTLLRRAPSPHYPWADPDYSIVHASIVTCQRNLLAALRTGSVAETSGDDNLKTVRMLFGCYKSAESKQPIWF